MGNGTQEAPVGPVEQALAGLVSFMDDLEMTYCGLKEFEANHPGLPDAVRFARDTLAKCQQVPPRLTTQHQREMEAFRTERALGRSDAEIALHETGMAMLREAMHKPKPFRCLCNGPRSGTRGVNSVGIPQMVCPDCVARIDRDADAADATDDTPVVRLGPGGDFVTDIMGEDLL